MFRFIGNNISGLSQKGVELKLFSKPVKNLYNLTMERTAGGQSFAEQVIKSHKYWSKLNIEVDRIVESCNHLSPLEFFSLKYNLINRAIVSAGGEDHSEKMVSFLKSNHVLESKLIVEGFHLSKSYDAFQKLPSCSSGGELINRPRTTFGLTEHPIFEKGVTSSAEEEKYVLLEKKAKFVSDILSKASDLPESVFSSMLQPFKSLKFCFSDSFSDGVTALSTMHQQHTVVGGNGLYLTTLRQLQPWYNKLLGSSSQKVGDLIIYNSTGGGLSSNKETGFVKEKFVEGKIKYGLDFAEKVTKSDIINIKNQMRGLSEKYSGCELVVHYYTPVNKLQDKVYGESMLESSTSKILSVRDVKDLIIKGSEDFTIINSRLRSGLFEDFLASNSGLKLEVVKDIVTSKLFYYHPLGLGNFKTEQEADLVAEDISFYYRELARHVDSIEFQNFLN